MSVMMPETPAAISGINPLATIVVSKVTPQDVIFR